MKLFIALLFTLVFLLGGLGGWLLRGQPAIPPAVRAQPPENAWSAGTLESYRRELALTDEQVMNLKPVMGETARTIRGIRQRVAGEVREAIRGNSAGVRKVLSPEQLPRFEALLETRRRELELSGDDPAPSAP